MIYLRHRDGMSLVSAMISVSFITAAIVFYTDFQSSMLKTQTIGQNTQDLNSIYNDIRDMLRDNATCNQNFRSSDPGSDFDDGVQTGDELNSLTDRAGNAIYTVGERYGPANTILRQLIIGDVTDAPVNCRPNCYISFELLIVAELRKARVGQPTELTKTLMVQSRVDDTGQREVGDCVSDRSSSNNYWSIDKKHAALGFTNAIKHEGIIRFAKGIHALPTGAVFSGSRGQSSVDLQTDKSPHPVDGPRQTTQGDYSVITGGRNNEVWADGDYGNIVGGHGNMVRNTFCSVGGGYRNSASVAGSSYCSLIGGELNGASNNYTLVGGGKQNSAGSNGSESVVLGGSNNDSNDAYGLIIGGSNNTTLTSYSTILSGYTNHVKLLGAGYNSIVGGENNQIVNDSITSQLNFIGVGKDNTVAGANSTRNSIGGGKNNSIGINSDNGIILGGDNNTLSNGIDQVITGGKDNSLSAASYSVILGGVNNSVQGIHNTIAAGQNNRTSNASDNFTATGNGNINQGTYSFIGAGTQNAIEQSPGLPIVQSFHSAILSGDQNRIQGSSYSFIGTGESGVLNKSSYSTIPVANNNVVINSDFVTVAASPGAIVINSADYSSVLGGQGHISNGFTHTSVAGGSAHRQGGAANYASVMGGASNQVNAVASASLGGTYHLSGSYAGAVAGQYNNTTASSTNSINQPANRLFSVGVGTSSLSRQNALEVKHRIATYVVDVRNGVRITNGGLNTQAVTHTAPNFNWAIQGGDLTLQNGDITAEKIFTQTVCVSASDMRAKIDLGRLDPAGQLKKIAGIPVYHFKWKKNAKAQYGVVAQELKDHYPDLIYRAENDDILKVHYLGLIAPLIGAVQKLERDTVDKLGQIDELKRQRAALLAKLEGVFE